MGHPIIKRKLQDRCRVFRDEILSARKAIGLVMAMYTIKSKYIFV